MSVCVCVSVCYVEYFTIVEATRQRDIEMETVVVGFFSARDCESTGISMDHQVCPSGYLVNSSCPDAEMNITRCSFWTWNLAGAALKESPSCNNYFVTCSYLVVGYMFCFS